MAQDKKGLAVAVANSADAHVLQAVHQAKKHGIADFILVGDKEKSEAAALSSGICISEFEFIQQADTYESCKTAVSLVANGKAAAVMKGAVETSTIMKAVLDKEVGIRTDSRLSHLAVFELPTYHKLLYITDAAINIAPDFETKKDILVNAVAALNNMGMSMPKTALIAAKEVVDEKMPVTLEYEKLVVAHRNGAFLSNAVLDGPLALDNAVSKESCDIKGINSPVGGDADLLLCPDIEAGNILYKSLAFLAGARNGGLVLGAKRPIILTSRADSAESKLISIALGVSC